MFFPGSIEEELYKATPEQQGHLVCTALQRVFLKSDWKRSEAVITLPRERRINPDPASTAAELMQCQSLVLKEGSKSGEVQEEEVREGQRRCSSSRTRGGVEEQKAWGRERGSCGLRESPTSAVTTTRSAAVAADCDCCSNKADSCHKHLLLNMTHTHTHTAIAQMSLFAVLLYGTLISFVFLLSDKAAAAVIALCSLQSVTAQSLIKSRCSLIMMEYLSPLSDTFPSGLFSSFSCSPLS